MGDCYDVIIIGGGLVGSSIAWRLASEGKTRVAVLDVDLAGHFSSSELNAGACRTNWIRKVNVDLVLKSVEFYETIREEVGFKQRGFLWLHNKDSWTEAKRRVGIHRTWGLNVEELDLTDVKRRFPDLDSLDGIEAATCVANDGIINSNLLKQYYRARAKAAGATFFDYHMVSHVQVQSANEVSVTASVFDPGDDPEEVVGKLLTTNKAPSRAQSRLFRCNALVNATGAWAKPVASLWKDTPPTWPIRRQICLLHSKEIDLGRYGVIVSPDGMFCHPEAGHVLAGFSQSEEPEGFSFRYDGSVFFTREILPKLVKMMPRFEKARHMGGWSGLYGMTPDQSGLLGRVPNTSNVYEAVCFSGRGAVQSYAIGLAMADLILHGRFLRIDASNLDRSRFLGGKHELEPLIL